MGGKKDFGTDWGEEERKRPAEGRPYIIWDQRELDGGGEKKES